MFQPISLTLAASVLFFAAPSVRGAEFTVEQSPRGVTVKLDGKLLTEYVINDGPKPYYWPLIGPGGKPITRAFPMRDVEGERQDHRHHRSFWFTHGDVNGVDFWSEGSRAGRIVHRSFLLVKGGQKAVIVSRNDWVDANGKIHCMDVRAVTFAVDGDNRLIDFDITITASEGPVTFGDTKEGTFGVRVATEMDVERKNGGKIVNSEGQTDATAWGKQAKWVDYHGPVDGQVVGVAIMNHPSSFRFPTYWHVRTYGLFAANPFGWHDFRRSDEFDGAHRLESGESFDLRYRVLLHNGDEKMAKIEDAYATYEREKRN